MARKKNARGVVPPQKAREILHDGKVHGKPLTPKQRRFMGAQVNKGRRKS